MATGSMRKNTKDATRRAAGPPGHARGPTTPPFLVGSQGAVAVRWVSDPQPAYDPGATGEHYVTLWTLRDDGPTAARGPPRGPAAEQASDPRTRGDAKRQLVRAGFWRQMDNQRTASLLVRCGRPACITNAYSWHNLQLVHRLGDYHGTPIINPLMHLSFPSSTRGKVALTRAT